MPAHKAIHICNSHELTHRPKIAKEYVLPPHGETVKEKAHTPNKMYKSLGRQWLIESEYI